MSELNRPETLNKLIREGHPDCGIEDQLFTMRGLIFSLEKMPKDVLVPNLCNPHKYRGNVDNIALVLKPGRITAATLLERLKLLTPNERPVFVVEKENGPGYPIVWLSITGRIILGVAIEISTPDE